MSQTPPIAADASGSSIGPVSPAADAARPTPSGSGAVTTDERRQDRFTASPLPRRGLERLDLLLLCLEALDLNGGEAMVWMSDQMGFAQLFPNRVELWKRRCHNPLRRFCRRGELAPLESDALIRILCQMADRLYPLLRALLSSHEPADLTQQRWQLFSQRLSDLLRERMNPRRSGVQQLLDREAGEPLRLQLVRTLALASGSGGFERLRASLHDAVA